MSVGYFLMSVCLLLCITLCVQTLLWLTYCTYLNNNSNVVIKGSDIAINDQNILFINPVTSFREKVLIEILVITID